MNLADFKRSLSSPEAIYLVVTDQDYLRRKVRALCQEQVPEEARSFDWNIFDLGKDRPQEVLDCARTVPWISGRRWLYVRHGEKAGPLFKPYLKEPSPRAVMVLECARKPAGWPKLPTIEMGSRIDLSRWLSGSAKKAGYAMGPEAAQLMVELVGDDVQQLENELEKQMLRHLEEKEITVHSVLELTFSARERDIFELIGALAGRRKKQVLRILNELMESGMSPQQILSMLYWNFTRLLVARELLEKRQPFFQIVKRLKIWSYKQREREIRNWSLQFLQQALLNISRADRLLKTSTTDARAHLQRVLIDTCRTGPV